MTSPVDPASASIPVASANSAIGSAWSPESWKAKPAAQEIGYPDAEKLLAVTNKLRSLPPLVTSWEIERLRALMADAETGKRFLLQGGDCAETLADCRPDVIANKLKILLQMSVVLIHGAKRPVVRVGRFAGQYAKPRSKPTESRDGVELPSYFGDLVNRQDFTVQARTPDPELLLQAYLHSAATINFVRSLTMGGFADLHHPEFWDLSNLSRAELPEELRHEYTHMTREIGEAIRFMEALGEAPVDDLTRVEFFASHEGLSLHYESAQTRKVPRRTGYYDLTTHLPWIGERTRDLGGAHIDFFRGIRNPVGVKVGPKATPEEVLGLVRALNPANEAGKLMLITRMGAANVTRALPNVVDAVQKVGAHVLWVSDPMHGNGQVLGSGIKTRSFDDILSEVEQTFAVHKAAGSVLGGVHFELTGDDVTECIGGGLSEADLDRNYASACDPRLNYRQALEMAFRTAKLLKEGGAAR
ncbi:MAG: 3-deoxy-7-phosphoheptulonate synthase class II [Deltaproteobacteria bacterium]|nr:3-deoxy-7-phosphoheptulonate synthase class II [Deltaproteobacteria bacterium]